jgi:hypothetical protein
MAELQASLQDAVLIWAMLPGAGSAGLFSDVPNRTKKGGCFTVGVMFGLLDFD